MRWCPACVVWQSGAPTCPACGASLADELAPGLPVRVAYGTGRERLGWARVERFAGVVEAVGAGPWPCVDVRTADGVRTVWCGRAAPDTAGARAAAAVRTALAFTVHWVDAGEARAFARARERQDDAAQAARGRVVSMSKVIGADELRARHERDGTAMRDATAEVLRQIQAAIVESQMSIDPAKVTPDNVAALADKLSNLWVYFFDLTDRLLVPSIPPPARKLSAVG